MRNFRELTIWQKGIELTAHIYKITAEFPPEEKFGIISQMRRSARSISSNIAEGCCSSDKMLNRHLSISIGSSFELETDLIICGNLGYIQDNDQIIQDIQVLQMQMSKFQKTLKFE